MADESIIDVAAIEKILNSAERRIERKRVLEILQKARECKGLSLDEVAVLMYVTDKELLQELYLVAQEIKREIYGNRLVLFAPLYVSNVCGNNCLYCAFRTTNDAIVRRTLTQQEVAAETKLLIDSGQKRILMVAGENYSPESLDYIIESIATVYATKNNHGEIRRLNVNIAPLDVAGFKRLKEAEIGTYQIFQETYHPETYQEVHIAGRKADYKWRVEAMDRAMTGGIDDVGIGVLYGLYDWKFETLALLQHTEHLDKRFGVGPHTLSVPRLEPATGSELASNPPYPLSDENFCKLVAILRLAVPYTGIIMSTRETAAMRHETFKLGVSQISAGSRTDPGGYSETNKAPASQFSLGDHRTIDEVVADIATLGYIPSFCTACYRVGRVGMDFMKLAKTGKIKNMCGPNALLTFKEYLLDYASPKTRAIGEELIAKEVAKLNDKSRKFVENAQKKLLEGERDIFV